jgi:hypothetical protein
MTVTRCQGLGGCELSRIPHYLDNQLADDGEVASLMLCPLFASREIFWYSLLLAAV